MPRFTCSIAIEGQAADKAKTIEIINVLRAALQRAYGTTGEGTLTVAIGPATLDESVNNEPHPQLWEPLCAI